MPIPTSPASGPVSEPMRRFVRTVVLIAVAALLAYAAWMWSRTRSDPSLPFLTAAGPATWLVHDEPVKLDTHGAGQVTRGFRTHVVAPAAALTSVALRVRAMKHFNVLIDGKAVATPSVDLRRWKAEQVMELAPHLSPGRHELRILVQNENGPVAVWASCEAAGIHTDAGWESTADGATWVPARRADARPAMELSGQFERPHAALLARWPVFATLFVLVGGASFALSRRDSTTYFAMRAPVVRWLVLAAWALMAANNILKLPAGAGFDVSGHLDYISYLLKHHRLPLATDGWQMFQSPLNYLLSAPLFATLATLFEPATAALLVRILPLACGLVQIELCYRAVRRMFPGRDDLQVLGTIFAGALPMNIYLSQYVGNEPLAGVLSAAAFLLCLTLLRPAAGENLPRTLLWMGGLFGLALLTKVSAILMAVPLLVAIACASFAAEPLVGPALIRLTRGSGIVLGMATLIAGWYYLRNWLQLGRPFVGGWDASRGITWWQDPGFRTVAEYLDFGASLSHPICAGVQSFWDGVYATMWCDSFVSSAVATASLPPWNHGFMLASVLLALVPTAALLLGIGIMIRNTLIGSQPDSMVILACVGVYSLALFHHSLTLPYHCAIKAFYTIGAMPAYALLAVAGFERMTRTPLGKSVLHGLFACWACAVYVGYFAHGL